MNAPSFTESLSHNGQLAVELASAGLFIFPAFNHPGNHRHKRPLVDWRDESTNDPDIVKAWWTGDWRHAMPGIDLSKSNLIVIDGDRHTENQNGPREIEKLLQSNLSEIGCPVVVTPSGGVHAYFIQPQNIEPLGNSSGNLPHGVDVRGAGGYVIAPGAATGDKRLYRRLPGTEELIDAFHAGSIPYLPNAIVEAIRAGREDKRVVTEIDAPQPRVYTKSGNREGAWGAAALENELRRIADAPKGSRNNVLAAKAFYLGTIAARGWIDPSAAIAGMMGAVKGWTDPKKTISTLNRCFTAGLGFPHDDLPDSRDDYENEEIMRLGREAVDAAVRAARDEVISEARDDGFLFDPQTGEILESSQPSGEEERALHEKWQERIREKTEQARRKAEEEFKSKNDNASVIVRATPFPWPDPRSIPPREFLLGDHLIRGFCSATVSPGGLGKSSLLIAEAASLITGRALLHNVQPHEPANVWIPARKSSSTASRLSSRVWDRNAPFRSS